MITGAIIYALGVCTGCFFWWLSDRPLIALEGTKGRPDCTVSTRLPNGDWLLTFSDGSRYRGRSTVWRHYPSGKRCGTTTESWLSDVSTELEWREEDLAASKRAS